MAIINESIQFVYSIHERKGGKGSSESLRELTAGAEKYSKHTREVMAVRDVVCSIKAVFHRN